MSQSVFPKNENNGNFKQPQTASLASGAAAPSTTVNFQNDDPRFKAAGGTMMAQRPFSQAFGTGPGMGPAPSDPVLFASGPSSGGMPKQQQPIQFSQQPMGGPLGNTKLPANITFVERQVSSEPAPEIRDADVNWMRSMATSASPDEACAAFLRACADQRILDVEANGFKLEGRYFSESHKMAEFYVGIYTLQGDRRTVVEINSSQGPIFQEFLTNVFGRMKHLADFTTEVNTEQPYNWSPLPLPILGMDEDGTPSSPDMASSDLDAPPSLGMPPPMLPLGGFPPEISLSLGFSVGDEAGDPDAQKRMYLDDLVDSVENGYAREIADAAPNLAVESENADSVRILRQVDQVVQRLLAIVDDRRDACLVRCCVIALGNLLSDDEFAMSAREVPVAEKLGEASTRWSSRQDAFVQDEYIPKSVAITTEINNVMMKL